MALSDADLVRQTLSGDREAFGKLVERHRRTVYALALQRGFQAAEAEDTAQEVFVKAFRGLDALQDPTMFPRWLYGIAGHVFADAARARRRRRQREEPGLDGAPEPAEFHRPADALGLEEDTAAVLGALEGLAEEQRVALTLRYLEGLSPREIAERLGEPRGTIRSRIHHALRFLRESFGAGPRAAAAREESDAE
ncbi:MAG: RNA polymerase sigma factor [Planctomycetota bacterium]|nr:RNA polymerase sigma factor [Planctomycetota bacterium]